MECWKTLCKLLINNLTKYPTNLVGYFFALFFFTLQMALALDVLLICSIIAERLASHSLSPAGEIFFWKIVWRFRLVGSVLGRARANQEREGFSLDASLRAEQIKSHLPKKKRCENRTKKTPQLRGEKICLCLLHFFYYGVSEQFLMSCSRTLHGVTR